MQEDTEVRIAQDQGPHGAQQITWSHEVVYTLVGKPAAYQDISIPLFVEGYIINMDREEGPVRQKMVTHLRDLMSDAELYGWYQVSTFYGV